MARTQSASLSGMELPLWKTKGTPETKVTPWWHVRDFAQRWGKGNLTLKETCITTTALLAIGLVGITVGIAIMYLAWKGTLTTGLTLGTLGESMIVLSLVLGCGSAFGTVGEVVKYRLQNPSGRTK